MGEVLRAGAKVCGRGGELGTLEAVIIDPTTQVITDLVVSHDRLGPRVRVGRSHVSAATTDLVSIDLDADELAACPAFDITAVNEPGNDFLIDEAYMDPGMYYLEPFSTPLDVFPLGSRERIPKGEC